MTNPLTRWYKWKLSGIITVGGGAILLIAGLFFMQGQAEFFDGWSCDTLIDYVMDVDIPEGITPHNEITNSQHIKVHQYIQECQDNNRFSIPVDHLNP